MPAIVDHRHYVMMRPLGFEPITTHTGDATMKNPLDSLGQTITLGFALTIVVVLLIHAIV